MEWNNILQKVTEPNKVHENSVKCITVYLNMNYWY
jgi:hypothetical protein